ncbi:hypothetical protein WJX81_005021 [Elliptochloris bilobata]|uniref:Uncharacterized protein n=1 Tax=Elliptochloris bilobata TaxID=381761 RepID=A0AAW1RVJ5_9CHLO
MPAGEYFADRDTPAFRSLCSRVLKRGLERFESAWAEPGVQVVKLATVPEAAGLALWLPRTCRRLLDGSLAVHYELLRFEDLGGRDEGPPYRLAVSSQPPLFRHRTNIELALTIDADPADPGRCRQTLEGHVDVAVYGLGRMAEEAICESLRLQYFFLPQVIERWVRVRKELLQRPCSGAALRGPPPDGEAATWLSAETLNALRAPFSACPPGLRSSGSRSASRQPSPARAGSPAPPPPTPAGLVGGALRTPGSLSSHGSASGASGLGSVWAASSGPASSGGGSERGASPSPGYGGSDSEGFFNASAARPTDDPPPSDIIVPATAFYDADSTWRFPIERFVDDAATAASLRHDHKRALAWYSEYQAGPPAMGPLLSLRRSDAVALAAEEPIVDRSSAAARAHHFDADFNLRWAEWEAVWAGARVPPADVPNLRARLAQIFGMAAAWGFVAERSRSSSRRGSFGSASEALGEGAVAVRQQSAV